MALATMQAHMEAVCQFQNWCGEQDIDFIDRLETGNFFQTATSQLLHWLFDHRVRPS